MRIFVVMVVALSCFVSLGCGPMLQPAQQGEWANFHNAKHKVSKDARPAEKQPEK